MLKRMLNCPERITYFRLLAVCARRSAQVYAKVRLADVLRIEGSGLCAEHFEFALQSHYDFIITDLSQKPLFAVEFDGPGHDSPAQLERDVKKDELSRRFNLPMVRVRADDLHRSESRLDRLTELVEHGFEGSKSGLDDRPAVVIGPLISPLGRGRTMLENALCPLCGSGMVVKNGKYGKFLSCARFPECRGSYDLPEPSLLVHRQPNKEQGVNSFTLTRQWLIAGIILFGLTFIWFVAIIARSSTDRSKASLPAPISSETDSATVRQMNLLDLLMRRRGWNTAKREAEVQRILGYSCKYSELSKQEASKLITAWDDRKK